VSWYPACSSRKRWNERGLQKQSSKISSVVLVPLGRYCNVFIGNPPVLHTDRAHESWRTKLWVYAYLEHRCLVLKSETLTILLLSLEICVNIFNEKIIASQMFLSTNAFILHSSRLVLLRHSASWQKRNLLHFYACINLWATESLHKFDVSLLLGTQPIRK